MTENKTKILLIPQCLRNPQCKATFTNGGLECLNHCNMFCVVPILKAYAETHNYKVCVAQGGRMAIKFVKDNKPLKVVAIACFKELNDGETAITGLVWNHELENMPEIIKIKLLKDGCVNTTVNLETCFMELEK